MCSVKRRKSRQKTSPSAVQSYCFIVIGYILGETKLKKYFNVNSKVYYIYNITYPPLHIFLFYVSANTINKYIIL